MLGPVFSVRPNAADLRCMEVPRSRGIGAGICSEIGSDAVVPFRQVVVRLEAEETALPRGGFDVGRTVSGGEDARPIKAAGKGDPDRFFSVSFDGAVPEVFRKRVFQRAVRRESTVDPGRTRASWSQRAGQIPGRIG